MKLAFSFAALFLWGSQAAYSQVLINHGGVTYQIDTVSGTTSQLDAYLNSSYMPWWEADNTGDIAADFAGLSELNNVRFAYNSECGDCGHFRSKYWQDAATAASGVAGVTGYRAFDAKEYEFAYVVPANAVDVSSNTSNITTNTSNISTNASDVTTNASGISTNASDIATNASGISTNASDISVNSKNISMHRLDIANLQGRFGTSAKILDDGLEIGGNKLISQGHDGVISIGNYSIKFGNEAVGDQTMWATDKNGVVDINIANGSDLKINGVSVQGQIDTNRERILFSEREISRNQRDIRKNKKAIDTNRTNINNLGDGIAASTALGAALSALPVTPDDAPFSCGVGSGAYSSRFAMGLGCVAKLNQRLSLNAGGSHVFGGSSNYGGGSLDSVAWRGGFVLKLGRLDSPADTNEQLQSKVKELEERNASVDAKYSAIQEENAVIRDENAAIKQANKALMARLERLEAIALGQQPATTTASLK